jgi:hypothetical protein
VSNSLARGVVIYASVVAVGLPIGFFAPRPSGGELHRPASAEPSVEKSIVLSPSLAPASVAEPLEPAPVDVDGAESTELRALRVTERRLFADASPAPTPTLLPMAGGCPEGALHCDEAWATGWMAGLRMPDLPVHADPTIGRFVQYFTEDTDGRKIFRSWLKRSGKYRGVVEAALRARMLPRDLVALVYNESGFSPVAVSSAGAAGLWQLMPETARAYGLTVEADYDERRSVARASEAAAQHLSDLYEKFGTWELALAAYDVGYKGMLDRVRDTGSNDYWTLCKLSGGLPRETSLYVPKVLAIALVLNNLERFSLDDEHVDPPLETADLEVPAGASAAIIARAAGTSVQHLHELNPELLGESIPERGHDFVVHIPATGVARARVILRRLLDRRDRDGLEQEVGRSFDWGKDEVPLRLDSKRHEADAGAHTVYYRVGDHESLEEIARSFGTTAEEIIDTNYLDAGAKLQRGMLLSINVSEDVMARIARKRAATRLQSPDAATDPGAPAVRAAFSHGAMKPTHSTANARRGRDGA